MVRKEGPLALYKGMSAVYLRIGPHSFLTLSLWDVLKSLQRRYLSEAKLPTVSTVLAPTLASATAVAPPTIQSSIAVAPTIASAAAKAVATPTPLK